MGTKIEWTDETWNPIKGCTPISRGCDHCYAMRMAVRLRAMGVRGYEDGFRPRLLLWKLEEPRKWRKPRMVFCCSMGDVFHEDIPIEHIARVFDSIRIYDAHQYQVLTKRPERISELLDYYRETRRFDLRESENIWWGVSVENGDVTYRIDELKESLEGAQGVKFISFEPLLEDVGGIVVRWHRLGNSRW